MCLLIDAVLEFHESIILPNVAVLHVLPGTVSMEVAAPDFGTEIGTQQHSRLHFLVLPRNQLEGPTPKVTTYVHTQCQTSKSRDS